jgi:hypothetical protein
LKEVSLATYTTLYIIKLTQNLVYIQIYKKVIKKLIYVMILYMCCIACEDSSNTRFDHDQRSDRTSSLQDMKTKVLDMSLYDIGMISHYDHFIGDQNLLDTELLDTATWEPDLVDLGIIDDTPLYARLSLNDAEVTGSHSLLHNGMVLLDAGSKVRWTISPNLLPINAHITLSVMTQIWRFEDGLIRLITPQHNERYRIWGDGRTLLAPIRKEYANWEYHLTDELFNEDEYGVDHLPPLIKIKVENQIESIEIVSEKGGLLLGDLFIHGIDASLPVLEVNQTNNPLQPTTIEFESCRFDSTLDMEIECDDGARLNTLIANTETPLEIILISDSYHAQTPVYILKSQVYIKGQLTNEQTPIWHWSPLVNSGQSWPFIFRGLGPNTMSLNLLDAIEEGQRTVRLAGVLDDQVQWLRLTAQDFGEVPPVCIDGRDIEKEQRHQRQLFKVLDRLVSNNETIVTLDRGINVTLPLETVPKLTPVTLLTKVGLTNLHLLADCPSAMNDSFNQATCSNPEVIDDGAILSQYTEGLILKSISAQAFGKFTIEILDSLMNLVIECQMDHPSAYGSGGQGYGVHLIGASRTIVIGERVSHARHGVVVDFGSSDSQILNGRFADMNQALLDIHGEASRDTLIRGNQLEDSAIGVIVGGGGRQVHCNDGPRHHIIRNQFNQCGIAVLISDYTKKVYVRSNSFDLSSSHIGSAYGAHEILVERNDFKRASLKPLSVGFADTREMLVVRNRFHEVCESDRSFIRIAGAESPRFENNLWCVD